MSGAFLVLSTGQTQQDLTLVKPSIKDYLGAVRQAKWQYFSTLNLCTDRIPTALFQEIQTIFIKEGSEKPLEGMWRGIC